MTEKPKTNADRIREMSDEELSEKASRMSFCSDCPVQGCDFFGGSDACRYMWLEWLRSPVEESET